MTAPNPSGDGVKSSGVGKFYLPKRVKYVGVRQLEVLRARVDKNLSHEAQVALYEHLRSNLYENNPSSQKVPGNWALKHVVLLVLYGLLGGESSRQMEDVFGVPKSTFGRQVQFVIAHARGFSDKFITALTASERIEIAKKFSAPVDPWGDIVTVVVDGTHIGVSQLSEFERLLEFYSFKLARGAMNIQVAVLRNMAVCWVSSAQAAGENNDIKMMKRHLKEFARTFSSSDVVAVDSGYTALLNEKYKHESYPQFAPVSREIEYTSTETKYLARKRSEIENQFGECAE